MATTPVLQAVLLWHHHQITTPNLPRQGPGGGARQASGTLGRPMPADEAPAPEKEQHGETQG
jgi:hypothetical protein